MKDVPIVDPEATQDHALRAIGDAGVGAAAVRLDDGFVLLSASAILSADVDQERIGAVARRDGITLPNDAISLGGTSLSVRQDRMTLPSFDAPAGYKQCQVNGNHTYPLDYAQNACWHDDGELRTVYLGD